MATSNCRWFPVKTIPAALLNAEGKFNMDAFSSGDQGASLVGVENWNKIGEAVILDIQGKGEDAADALATVGAAKISVAQDNSNGKWYALVDASQLEYGTYAQLFELRCGMAANMPFVIGGALLLGLGGFAVGYAKSTKHGKGVPAYAFMGATVGLVVGALGGHLLAKVATPSYMKTAGMGALSVTSRRRRGAR